MNGSKLTELLKSKIFYSVLEKAGTLVTKNRKLSKVAVAALEKVLKTGSVKALGTNIVKQVKLLGHLTYFYATGTYRKVKQKSIIKIIAVLLYFIMPLDVIPDFIPFAGYLDDITLIGWIFSILGKELSAFEVWLEEYSKAETVKFTELE